ncbi:MAG: hypothetical protein U0793_28515 [Gemmataceae bacterium]
MDKRTVIDPDFDHYQGFFDHDWAKRMNAAAEGTPLAQIVLDLLAAWKAASNTHRLPWLAIHFFEAFAKGFCGTREPITRTCMAVVAERLPREMPGLRNMQRQEMGKVLDRISEQVLAVPEKAIGEFVAGKLWGSLLSAPQHYEFTSSIWASQRLCYGALYYGYEDFMVRIYRVVTVQPKYRMRRANEFADDLAQTFTRELSDYCTGGEVNIARLVRNALAHHGGRITEELKAEKHGVWVENGELQIVAADTHALFALLSQRAIRMTTEALARLSQQKDAS